MNVTSVSETARARSVVATKRPAGAFDRRSITPGSGVWNVPAFSVATIPSSTSTPTTSWPAATRHDARLSPTLPSPITEICIALLDSARAGSARDHRRGGVAVPAGMPERAGLHRRGNFDQRIFDVVARREAAFPPDPLAAGTVVAQ